MGAVAFAKFHDGNLAAILILTFTAVSGLVAPIAQQAQSKQEQKERQSEGRAASGREPDGLGAQQLGAVKRRRICRRLIPVSSVARWRHAKPFWCSIPASAD